MDGKPLLTIIGELLFSDKDWTNAEFGTLFRRLFEKEKGTGRINRYLRYTGEVNSEITTRFFGIQTDTVEAIPDGMVALELCNDSVIIHESGSSVTRQSKLVWEWLDTKSGEFPLGEFITHIHGEKETRFLVSGYSFSEQGKSADDDVEVVEYNPEWPALYDETVDQLQQLIPPEIGLRYEHYGSTSIPGMPAKPVVDILVEIPSFNEARKRLLPVFNRPECEYWWHNEHMLFVIRDRFLGHRTHHVHAAPANHPVWEGVIFRDYLRNHPNDAGRYADIKHRLAETYSGNRETYTENKYAFVREITNKALQQES
ncbi:MAG: GrpB family protein [Dehalococcoidales bacterium]|nr:GrpB family protein [Dehalococcoidales bacterium]